jgi:hypothetical protein
MRRRLALPLALALAACGEPALVGPHEPGLVAVQPDGAPAPAARAGTQATASEDDAELRRAVAAMLRRVAKKRALEPKTAVALQVLGRAELIARIRDKTDRELPKGVLEAQGELLRVLGLTAPDYDFVGGLYDLVESNIAGFYDQDSDAMFMPDDLPEQAVEETLAHELVHALQDQHFDLTALLDQRPGDSDRVTASHAICEGDAMSAMFDVTLGDAFAVDTELLRLNLVASVAFSGSGATTPRVLQAALIAPYVDGFELVQALRRRGGWGAVDAAYASELESTEQLLHIEKFDAREAPIIVAEPPLPEASWVKQDADVLGEQGLRMILEQWSTRAVAVEAAAGWGGDRFIVMRRDAEGGAEWAAAWHLRFDTAADTTQAEHVLKKQVNGCLERSDLGPLAWKRKGDAIAIVGGPYFKAGDGTLGSRSDCKAAAAWATKVLGTKAPVTKVPVTKVPVTKVPATK